MKSRALLVAVLSSVGLALVASAHAAETWKDPFAYCAAVLNIDAPDARYTGSKMPESIARGLQTALHAPKSAPLGVFQENSFWRCMNGKVWACTVGANLPCQEKADTSRTASAGMADFCRENPDDDAIPMFVTGRATVYQWRCKGGKPAIVKETTKVDARGFLADIWYEIPKP
jgi:hypothetical protein